MTKIIETMILSMLAKIINDLEPELATVIINEVKELGCKILGFCEKEIEKKG